MGSRAYPKHDAGGCQMPDELSRAAFPALHLCERAALPWIKPQTGANRRLQILIEHARDAVTHDIQWTLNGEGSHRYSASHCLEHHDTEGIGAAGKYEHIGRC